jgi:hypothetical protein
MRVRLGGTDDVPEARGRVRRAPLHQSPVDPSRANEHKQPAIHPAGDSEASSVGLPVSHPDAAMRPLGSRTDAARQGEEPHPAQDASRRSFLRASGIAVAGIAGGAAMQLADPGLRSVAAEAPVNLESLSDTYVDKSDLTVNWSDYGTDATALELF